MVKATIYPKADAKAQWFGNPSTIMPTIEKLVLHTTETAGGWPGYQGGAITPTLTYDPSTHKWRQHLPINGSARALVDPSGTAVRENRDGVVQVEISCYSDPKLAKVHGHYVGDLDAQAIAELGAFVAWLHTEWGLELAAAPRWLPYPFSAGKSAVRMTGPQFDAFKGVCGHQHVSGNNHGDPGALDVPAILAAADKIINPAPAPGAVYRLFNLNCETPLFASTDAAPWPTRAAAIARITQEQDASIFTAQELGRNEAASLAKALGLRWSYQRAQGDDGRGLNTVLWRDEWTLDTMREWPLPDHGQWTRSLITCKLVHATTGQYVWAASTHLATKGPDLSAANAVVARQAQAKQVAEIFKDYRQIIMGADLNTRNTDTDTLTEQTLRDGGWTLDADELTIAGLAGDRHKGIDAVLTKSRVTLQSVAIVPTGTASDHDARLAAFTVTDPKED